MVVDAHHHLWDPAHREYPWMGDELDAIRRRFDASDLKPLLDANGIDRTVVVQTVSSLEETREFLQTAAENEFIAGVVGWVDLTDRSVDKTIAGLKRSEGGSFLVGIRHQVHDEPDPRWLLRDDVQRGIAAVGEAGLAYDVLVRTRELPAALETVKRHPGIRFVIDHAAKPRIAAGPADSDWEAALAPMSDLANVTCKISGLFTEADWKSWTFGADRCMFGSDWPVSLLAASYEQVVTTTRQLVGDDDQIMGGTAARVYGLT